jgi:hypothetical protein
MALKHQEHLLEVIVFSVDQRVPPVVGVLIRTPIRRLCCVTGLAMRLPVFTVPVGGGVCCFVGLPHDAGCRHGISLACDAFE